MLLQNRVQFLLSLGYFRATGRFFAGKFQDEDVDYVAGKLGFLPGLLDIQSYDNKATASRHRKLILDHLGFREFSQELELGIRKEIRTMVRSQVRPKLILLRMIELLEHSLT